MSVLLILGTELNKSYRSFNIRRESLVRKLNLHVRNENANFSGRVC